MFRLLWWFKSFLKSLISLLWVRKFRFEIIIFSSKFLTFNFHLFYLQSHFLNEIVLFLLLMELFKSNLHFFIKLRFHFLNLVNELIFLSREFFIENNFVSWDFDEFSVQDLKFLFKYLPKLQIIHNQFFTTVLL